MKNVPYKNMIQDWNVLNSYEEGDIVIKGDDVQVYSKGVFRPVGSERDVKYDACVHAIEQYHKDKGLPGYDEIMEAFYKSHPEYLL